MSVQGPYGAPAQGYDQFKVLLLVGAGIGVTPFISILKDIWNKFDRRRCKNNECGAVNFKNFPLSKCYFNFISRDQASMGWFKDVLEPIVHDDKEQIIECHQHLTSVKADGDVRSAAIKITQATSIGMGSEKMYDQKMKLSQSGDEESLEQLNKTFAGKDIVTGTDARIPVHFGRPNWTKIFAYIRERHPLDNVGVFFCGPPVIGEQLDTCCNKFTTPNGSHFFYYEEHF
jgi:respiratory burst oxidase